MNTNSDTVLFFLFCVSKSTLRLEQSSLKGTAATKLLGPVFGRMGFIGDQA